MSMGIRTMAMEVTTHTDSLSLVDEFDRHWLGDQAGVDAALQEYTDGFAAARAVVERPFVHVHADEGVGLRAVEPTRELHRVIERPSAR